MVEEHVREALQRTHLVRLSDEERDVIVASAIRNHTHGDILHSVQDNTFEAEVVPVEVAHNAYDAHVRVDGYCAVLLQLIYNLVEMRRVVDTHRNAHLARRNHIDRSLVALENLEHLAEEASSKEHARRLDLDSRDIVLSCNSLNFAFEQHVVDDSALCLRVESVLDRKSVV